LNWPTVYDGGDIHSAARVGQCIDVNTCFLVWARWPKQLARRTK